MGTEKYLNFQLNNLNNLKNFKDILNPLNPLNPITIEMEKEEAINFKIPKASKIIKRGIGIAVSKFGQIKRNTKTVDQSDQIDYTDYKIINEIQKESKLTPLNQDIVSLEDIIEEYKNY